MRQKRDGVGVGVAGAALSTFYVLIRIKCNTTSKVYLKEKVH